MRRGQSRKFAKELGIRLGEWNWGDGEKGKYLQIVYLFSWQELYLFFATQFLYSSGYPGAHYRTGWH